MINIMLHEFSQDCVVRENYSTIYTGELEPYENQNADEEIQQKNLKDISIWYDGQNSRHLKEKDDWKLCLKPDAMQAQASSKLIGNLAHYFLQQIDFDCNLQRSTALKNTINFYGNLIPADKIIHICSQLSDFLETNKQFFDKTLWDVVYREFSVFSGNSEFRIDRLLISHKRHEIIVLDYKTGKITDPKQIENYKIIIEQIPFVKNNNYVVLPGQFLKIDLQM